MAQGEDIESRVRTRLIELLFRNAPLSYTVTLINAVLVYLVLDEFVPQLELLIWLVAIIVVTLLRLVLVSAYWNARHPYERINFYKNLHLAGIYLSGALWGVLVYLPGTHDEIWIESFVAVVISGMTTGAVLALSPLLSAVIPYLLLILLPLAIFFFLTGDFPHMAMGAMVSIYLLLLIRLVFRSNDLLVDAIRQQAGSRKMFEFLEKAKHETERQEDLLEDQITNLQGDQRDKAAYFDLLDLPLIITSLDGNIQEINPALLHAAGCDEADVIGIDIGSLAVAGDRPRIEVLLKNLHAGASVDPIRFRLQRPDREGNPCEWRTVRHENLIYWTGIPVGN